MLNTLLSPLRRSVTRTILVLPLAVGISSAQHYTQTNLAAGVKGQAPVMDPNLSNPWGLSRSSTSPWWVADAGSGVSTLYSESGAIVPLVVAIPGGVPIGTVYNGTGQFMLPDGKPAVFLFASATGMITGWAGGASATVVVNTPNAGYYGLAIASFNGQNYLYAADFKNGKIDVFNSSFQALSYIEPGVTDSWFKNFPGSGLGYSPHNVQNIGNTLYVAFARPDPSTGFELTGPGTGYVASFTPQGQLVKTFQSGTWLNAPWGLALAPGDFGFYSHELLVGQFGSGQIAAYNISTGNFDGLFEEASGSPLSIGGLWALSFGGGNAKSGPANSLYFTALFGGLFGTLTANSTDLTLGNGN